MTDEQLTIVINRLASMWAVCDAKGSVIFGYRSYDDERRAVVLATKECAKRSKHAPLVSYPDVRSIRSRGK